MARMPPARSPEWSDSNRLYIEDATCNATNDTVATATGAGRQQPNTSMVAPANTSGSAVDTSASAQARTSAEERMVPLSPPSSPSKRSRAHQTHNSHQPHYHGQQSNNDEEDSRYYTYSTDDGEFEELPTTPPEDMYVHGSSNGAHVSTQNDSNGHFDSSSSNHSQLPLKTPINAPISTVITSSEERRRRELAQMRRDVRLNEGYDQAHHDDGDGGDPQDVTYEVPPALTLSSSRSPHSSSAASQPQQSNGNSNVSTKRRKKRSERQRSSATVTRNVRSDPSLEETSTSGTSYDAYFDQQQEQQQHQQQRPHDLGWPAAFSSERRQQPHTSNLQPRYHPDQPQFYSNQPAHRQQPSPYQQPYPYYQYQLHERQPQPEDHHYRPNSSSHLFPAHHRRHNAAAPAPADWPSAFQDARHRDHPYRPEHEEAAAAAAAAAAGVPAAAGFGIYHSQQAGDYGSLVHPLATPDSSVASADLDMSPPSLTLPAPRLLPRKSASVSDESTSPVRHITPHKSPETTETGRTVPTSSTVLSKVEENSKEVDRATEDPLPPPQPTNLTANHDDDGEYEDEDDEEIGLLPDHLTTSYKGGRATVAGTAFINHPNSPISMITTDTGAQSDDNSSLSPRGRSLSKPDRHRHGHGGHVKASSSLLPSSHYAAQKVAGAKSSYGSTHSGPHGAQDPYQEVISKLSSYHSSTAHMSKKALRRHRRKNDEAEARERAVRAIRGVEQPPLAARSDRIWGILFLLQVIAVVVAAITLGPNAVMSSSSDVALASKTASRLNNIKISEDDPSLFDDDLVIAKTLPATDDYTTVSPMTTDDSSSQKDSTNATEITGGKGATSTSSVEIITDTISNGWSMIKVDYRNALQICCITGLYAAALTSLTIGFMMILAKSLIQTALIFTVLVCFAWGTVGIVLSPYSFVPILGFIALALSLGYSVVVWDSIPFHATNLTTALTGVRCVADTLVLGFMMLVLTFFWCILWGFAFIGTYDYLSDGGETKPSAGTDTAILSLLLVSFFWTYNVILGIIQAVVAGSIGNWWYNPASVNACCSNATRTPIIKAFGPSFGSICCGSLLVKPVNFFNTLAAICCFATPPQHNHYQGKNKDRQGKRRGERPPLAASETRSGGLFSRMRRDFLRALRSLCKIFNHWAFVYIGLYNYNFWESGKKATALFNTRGWSNIVSNSVVHNVLFMTSVVIALCTGLFGLIVEEFDGYEFTSFNKPTATAFIIGSLIGLALSGVMLSVLGSATNVVLVCFAAGNVEFSRIHPQLSQDMKESWSTVWSGYFVN